MKNIYFILFIFISGTIAYGQQIIRNKSLSVKDSLITNNKTILDTTFSSLNVSSDSLQKTGGNEIDAVVYATCTDSLFFNVKNKKMHIYGKGEVKYKNTDLTSGQIDVNFVTSQLTARGWKDTTANKDSGFTETPVLSEDGEVYEGNRLKYNFKTEKGFISLATNKKGDSRYGGEKVKKVARNIYFIKNGIYTTCKSNPPHTYFGAKEMKVIQGDKIIAKWIFMYIEGVPIPIPIPFAVFPSKSGRKSGIIIPTFGQTARQGSYFRNFGYFFALSDYYDLTLTGDYYTRGGYGVRSRIRYAKRYNYTGNINASYSKQIIGESNDADRQKNIDWRISVTHNQHLTPTMRLNANLQFQSGSYLQNNTTGYNNLLRSDLISNATLSKRWDKSGNSLTINYNRRQELQTGNIFEELPSLSFSVPAFFPFQKKGEQFSGNNKKWYESLSINYNNRFTNRRNKIDGKLNIRGGFQQNIGINSTSRIGYFNISPRINYVGKWYNKYTVMQNFILRDVDSTGKVTLRDSLVSHDAHAIKAVRTFDFGLSAQTKVYGMFNINTFGIEALRHTIEPRLTYSFRPDFSSDIWGYYASYKTASGKIVKYDKFGKEIFGGASSGERQMLNFSLGNIFEIKTIKDPNDTTSQQKKIRLLNVNADLSYNFSADTLQLSDLNIRYRTQISDLLNLSAGTGYTFYDYNGKNRINKFLASQGKGLFRLNNLSFSISTSLSSKKIEKYLSSNGSLDNQKSKPGKKISQKLLGENNDPIYEETKPNISIPWNLSLNYNYLMNKQTASDATVNSNISANISINLTKNWKISASGSYDFQRKEFSAPTINIFRNLDCWEMSFTWNPIGVYRGFRFEIRMTAPELRDIKITRSEGLYTGRR